MVRSRCGDGGVSTVLDIGAGGSADAGTVTNADGADASTP